MAITNDLDNIVNWLRKEVCPCIQLKVPDDYRNDGGYSVKLTTPAAFAMYIPTQDNKPPDVEAPIPSICVQVMQGEHLPAQHIGEITIQLALAAWNPGEHGGEKVLPEVALDALGGYTYTKIQSEEFERSNEGWRDVWNMIDIVLAALENTEYIASMRVKKEEKIKYGPFTVDDDIVSYYPYWFGWIRFTLEHGLARKIPESYEKFL